jgi:two-component system, LuxR family, sensor kinase FixL
VVSTTLEADYVICVNVTDTGPAIALDIVFTTTKQSGMGVGPSISRTIIESHGGQITVAPNADGVTIFRFTLRGVGPEELDDGK